MELLKLIEYQNLEELILYIIDDFYGAQIIDEKSFNDETINFLTNQIISYKNYIRKNIKILINNKPQKRKLTKYNKYISKKIKELKFQNPEIKPIYRFSVASQIWKYDKIKNQKIKIT
jgi:hypothetical protein